MNSFGGGPLDGLDETAEDLDRRSALALIYEPGFAGDRRSQFPDDCIDDACAPSSLQMSWPVTFCIQYISR